MSVIERREKAELAESQLPEIVATVVVSGLLWRS